LLSDKIVNGVAGAFQIEKTPVEMSLIAMALIVMGVILYIVDKKSPSKTEIEGVVSPVFVSVIVFLGSTL
jgi:undecaprenyl pyrophosphate phosphatase UppP